MLINEIISRIKCKVFGHAWVKDPENIYDNACNPVAWLYHCSKCDTPTYLTDQQACAILGHVYESAESEEWITEDEDNDPLPVCDYYIRNTCDRCHDITEDTQMEHHRSIWGS